MSLFDPVVSHPADAARATREARAAGRAIERLPFTIRRVETEADLLKAVKIRHAAYARHVPDFARSLALPEAADYEDDTIVLLAESKLDGSPIGSTRIRTNLFRPLGVEESVVLPSWLQGRRLVEATRLGIDEGRTGRVVKMALIKACFMYCEDNAIDYSVATGRPPVDRQYEQLLFSDVFPEQGAVPLRHVGNLPHRVMAFEIASFEQRYRDARHPLSKFFFDTQHPDIDVGPATPPALAKTRVAKVTDLTLHTRQFAIC
ncbi:N-acyl amino acid synthase FeeM domain-containing protein [Massilia sp.]|uniref:N-acyl amino acid synthase FeeM domain-containing protein n=1 Tax=Massilia sp. TaxID=1882437 RepID=UPI00391DD501